MIKPQLFRRRFIPSELIHLKDDEILIAGQDLIITRWKTLHPRHDIARGISAFYLDKGFKVSKIYNEFDQVVYWYCDIIQVKKDSEKNTVIIEDLLIDIILFEDGSIRIMDLDELAEAQERRLISLSETNYALKTANSLLQVIYDGRFHILQEPVNQAELL